MKKARFLSVFMISAMLLGGCGQAGPQTQEPSQTPRDRSGRKHRNAGGRYRANRRRGEYRDRSGIR